MAQYTEKNYEDGELIQRPPLFDAVITGSDEYSIEFNDANASTLYWKSSRYNGKQLFTTELNKVSSTVIYGSGSVAGEFYTGSRVKVDDRTGYGNSACAQKYTRNIYLGNAIVGMNDGGEDPSLLNFPNFSYVQTNTYYTVNSDDSISVRRLESTQDNFNARRGFYRAFYEDFPVGKDCKIILNDTSVKQNLQESHTVFFNGGQLKKILVQQPLSFGSSIFYKTSSNTIEFLSCELNLAYVDKSPPISETKRVIGGTSSIYNPQLTYDFFTSSLDDFTRIFSPPSSEKVTMYTLFDGLRNQFLLANEHYRVSSSYKGNKRIFITFQSSSYTIGTDPTYGSPLLAGVPINTNIKYNIPSDSNALVTNNLAQLSTTEIVKVEPKTSSDQPYHTSYLMGLSEYKSFYVSCSEKYILNQNYFQKDAVINEVETSGLGDMGTPLSLSEGTLGVPENFCSGSYTISLCDDSIPSLLIPLDKTLEVLDGIGQKGFVIIPNNLHPHIRQNLSYYLSKAGVPLGVDTIPVIDNTFKKLK